MSDHANDVMKQYQAWAQQSWDAWMQSLQRPAAPPAPADDLLARAMGGLKSYADWMRRHAPLPRLVRWLAGAKPAQELAPAE